jgi:hypothetical protein
MKSWTLVILVAFCASACQTPAGTVFKANVMQPDASYSMPVALGDQTGLVTAIESATGDGSGSLPAVQEDPDDPHAVIVSWGTGACDKATGLSFEGFDAGYRLDIQIDEGFNLTGCTAQVVIRGLRVRFSKGIPVDSITVRGGL